MGLGDRQDLHAGATDRGDPLLDRGQALGDEGHVEGAGIRTGPIGAEHIGAGGHGSIQMTDTCRSSVRWARHE